MDKKILLIGYTKLNLGDDLFLTLVINRYKNYKIDLYCDKRYTIPFKTAKNVNIINRNFYNEENIDISNYCLCIYVGGSIFQERYISIYAYKAKELLARVIKDCKKNNIPFYFLSSNFGPYLTEKYFKLCDECIKNCSGINFRDKKSYDVFKKYENVHYIPDLAYSLEFNKKKTINNTVGVSLINIYAINRGDIDKYYFEYMKFLKKNIEKYVKDGKTVYLYSFCTGEQDDKAIETLMSMIDSKCWNRIKKVYYKGNLEEFLNIYSRMEYMLCTRFHAMILSSIFKQKLVVVNYSTKISNVINDYKLKCTYIEIDKDIENKIIPLKDYKVCSNVDNIREAAKDHYLGIDKDLSVILGDRINRDFTLRGYYPIDKFSIRKWLGNKKRALKRLIKKVLILLKIIKPKKVSKKEPEIIDYKEQNINNLEELLKNNKISKETCNNCKKALGYKYEELSTKEVKKGPLVSVIIPTYKRDDYLFDAVDSVLDQSYKNVEIIVVDDYVESNLEPKFNKKYKKYSNITYTKNKVNSYAGISRMNGYRLAKGEYVIYCDDDDFYIDKCFIEKAVNTFLSDRDINIVGFNSFTYYFDINRITFKNNNFVHVVDCLDYINAFQLEYFKSAPSFTAFRKSILDDNDFYNLEMMNDSTIFLNAMKSGKMIIYNDPVGFYRMHSANITNSLNYKFLIDNLAEKKKIYEYLKKNKYVQNPDYWWYQQLRLTINYYLTGSKRNNKDFKVLMNWCMNNMTKYRRRLLQEMKKVQKKQLKK